jgi:glycosyltransferase family protein
MGQMEDYQKVNQIEQQMRTLEDQFGQLCRITENLQQKVLEQEQTNQLLVRSNQQLIEWLNGVIRDMNMYQENARYELLDPRLSEEDCWYPQIQEVEESVQDIILNHKSLCRFGDGEFATIDGVSRHHFQTIMNPLLSVRLEEVLRSADENILIAIANNYGNLEAYTEQAKREIRAYMTKSARIQHKQLLQKGRVYVDTYLTRPYMMYTDKHTKGPMDRFTLLQKIWDKRKCIFVEGEQSRLGVGNDLFANALSVQRVLCPAENAFEKYDEILTYCKQLPSDALYLIALGPTATVLAYDLAKSGRQALDIGHVDLEYEWYLRDLEHREIIQGKYTNECSGGDVVEDVETPEYQKEILKVIGS